MKLVVRRRTGPMVATALLATLLSAGYLWRFGQTHDELALIIGLGLALIAVIHAVAWWSGARSPLLVADDTGLLVRAGGAWTGVPWPSVERVEVRRPGRLSDGRLSVVPALGVEVSRPTGWRSRMTALSSERGYDDALVVPFGLTTSVSEPDVVAALTRLAYGRAPIVIPAEGAEQEPTVELAELLAAPEIVEREPAASPGEPIIEAPRPKSRLSAVVEAPPVAPLARVVSSLAARPASRPAVRREEVIAGRATPGADGALALSHRIESQPEAETLPEIGELRRPLAESRRATDSAADSGAELERGNVGLIIDATTDLSARAMQKVRRPAAPVERSACPVTDRASDPATDRSTDPLTERPTELIIGAELAEARQRLGLSVDELAERTRIRPYVIESIEADNFGPCGGDFYARGHLRMLARVLGLDGDPMVASYDEHFATSPIKARDVFEVELATGTTGMVQGGDSRANWGALIAAVVVLALLWGLAGYLTDAGNAAADGTQPGASAPGPGSPGAGNTPLAQPRVARVKVTARDGDARVVVEDRFGQVVFHGLVREGTSKQLRGEAPLRVVTPDGGVTALAYGGQKYGLMGDPGERAREVVRASAR